MPLAPEPLAKYTHCPIAACVPRTRQHYSIGATTRGAVIVCAGFRLCHRFTHHTARSSHVRSAMTAPIPFCRTFLLAPLHLGLALFLLLASASIPARAALMMGEFRLRGFNGANDEFVAIYNDSSAPHTVAVVSGTGYGLVASD